VAVAVLPIGTVSRNGELLVVPAWCSGRGRSPDRMVLLLTAARCARLAGL